MLSSRNANGQKFDHICFLAAAVGHDIQDPEIQTRASFASNNQRDGLTGKLKYSVCVADVQECTQDNVVQHGTRGTTGMNLE